MIESDYWDVQAETWDRVIHSADSPHYHYYKTSVVHIQNALRGKRLALEPGCGTCDCTLQVIRDGLEIIAFDFSMEMLSSAKEKINTSNVSGIHLVRASTEFLPFRDRAFDVVFSRGALLNYLGSLQDYFAELSRVLKDGATLCVDFITGRPGGVANYVPRQAIEEALTQASFVGCRFLPMGVFLRALSKSQKLLEFVNQHVEAFAQIEAMLADYFKTDQSIMAMIEATKGMPST